MKQCCHEEEKHTNGMMIFGHIPISISKTYQFGSSSSIRQPQILCAFQVTKDSFNGFPVCQAWLGQKMQDCLDSKQNIGVGAECGVHQ
jgi:hypothetical protein